VEIGPGRLDLLAAARSEDKGEGRADIGVAICRDIVGAHGGVLETDGEPGHGAVFRLRLPAAPAA
jgi:two-component system OmpR family sensor kinase